MQATFESRTNMAYIYLTEPGDSRRVAHTEPLIVDLPSGARRLINLDFDAGGRLVGIEIEGAAAGLPASLLAAAQRSSRRPAPGDISER
jgi:uncharacterized protein YuzE